MISFEIGKDEKLCAVVGIDKETDNIGFVSYEDEDLNAILSHLVDNPCLLVTSGDNVGLNYVMMEERVTLKDERFYDVLKCQLSDYQFTSPSEHDTDLHAFLDEAAPQIFDGE